MGSDKEGKEGKKETREEAQEVVSVALNSHDRLYAEIRDFNIERLGPHLGGKAKAIRGQYDSFRANKVSAFGL